VRDLARTYTGDALETLVEIMRSKTAHPTSRALAANAILDRAWGKPSQPVGGADDLPPLQGVTRIEVVAVAAAATTAAEREDDA